MVIAIVIVMLLSVIVMQHSVLPLRLADMRATTCVLESYVVQTVLNGSIWEHFVSKN